MGPYVAFLKGINVGGHTVKMARLAQVFSSLGCADVRTFIASGNVVFSSTARSEAALARRIEAAVGDALGFEAPTFLRPVGEVCTVAMLDPFPGTADGNRYVGFLEAKPAAARVRAIEQLTNPVNRFTVRGRDIHWWSAGGLTDSGFSYTVLEQAVAAPATFRSIKTILRLAGTLTPA